MDRAAPRRRAVVALVAGGLLAGVAVLYTDWGYRLSAEHDTLRTVVAQLRAYVRLGEPHREAIHPSLAPRLIRVGTQALVDAALPETYVVVAFNLAAPNRSADLPLALETLRDVRDRYDPHLLLLTEAPGDLELYARHPAFAGFGGFYAWDRLNGADPALPFADQPEGFAHTGNALLARLPLRAPRLVVLAAVEEDFGRESRVMRNAVVAKVGDIAAASVHLAAHTRPAGRHAQVQALLPFLDERTIPGGDWNFFQRHLGDALEPGYGALRGRGFADTLPRADRFRHRSRLRLDDRMYAFADHVFAPPAARAYEAVVREAPGSDHDLLVARIAF